MGVADGETAAFDRLWKERAGRNARLAEDPDSGPRSCRVRRLARGAGRPTASDPVILEPQLGDVAGIVLVAAVEDDR